MFLKGFFNRVIIVWLRVNHLQDNNILDYSKSREHQITYYSNDAIHLWYGRKQCGKMRKCWLPASSPFPTMFSKALLSLRGCLCFNPFPNKFWLSHVCSTFENTVGKGEIAHNEQFLLYPQCFLPIWRTFCHCDQICKLSSANSFFSSANSFSLEVSKICRLGKG